MARYKNTSKFMNDADYYEFLTKKRGVKRVVQYGTPLLHNPTARETVDLKTSAHIWAYGDRYYNLASQYYGEPTYWWVIAWFNGAPTEAHLEPGDIIEIPISLEQALRVLGV